MELFINITLNGISNGMIFAALALALVLIFRATRIINFAQGAMGMMTTFIASTFLAQGLGYWWVFVVVLAIGFAFGALVERILIRPLQGKSELNPVIVTIGLLVVLEGLAGAIYGNASHGFPAAYSQSGLTIGHTKIAFSHFDLFILVAVVVLMVGTLVLFRLTTLGLRMRASAFAGEISRLLGVRVGLLLTLGWAMAGVAGSLAGFLVAPTSSFGPYFMDLILVYAFTAAVIGGLESPVGALIGGLITGLCISYVGGYLGSGLEPLGALVLLMVALMARPEGIFARPQARRV
ncbi:MAG TPA: branched-chain amino acid ABC transporter permease [Acidimicrobiales bacterium]|jgi:branched-chain amino acid transport system permease protein|nr:branched-chain amino acid ABC transporter permease [Acidimicrobiales bacterium]